MNKEEINLPEIQIGPKRSTLLLGILILFISLFVIPFIGKLVLTNLFGINKASALSMWVSRLLFWVCLLIVVAYSFRIEKQRLLVWEEKKFKLYQYPLSVIGIFMALIAGLFFIGQSLKTAGFQNESAKFNEMLVLFRANKLLVIFTALTAGFVEELTFRGYLLPRLIIITKSPVIGILLSSVLFGLLHIGYGTLIQVVAPFFIGLVFAYYYWEFRNLKVLIFCHVAWDLMVIFLKM